MPLAMARPWKHPKTGIYWLRKAVPDALRPLVGKREEKLSLNTRDPNEARQRHAEALAEIERRWASLRAGPRTLSEREAHAVATAVHDRWLDQHRDEPSQQTFWPVEIGPKVFAPLAPLDLTGPDPAAAFCAGDPSFVRVHELREWCYALADHELRMQGLIVDADSRLKLAKAIAAAVQQASLTLSRYAGGERESGTAEATFRPAVPQVLNASPLKNGIHFELLVKSWAAEKHPAPKTLYEWKRTVGQFATFLGHEDASRVTPDDVIRWKEALIAKGLAPKTISDGKLVAVRTILQWGADNRRLTSNPAERVRMDVKRKAAETIRGFSDEEAAIVLRAALGEADPVLRWVPWLCAYSGARVSEVCQLRREDVRPIEGIWCMKFDPEAGPLKTASSERAVPLHKALLDRGFLAFAHSVASGPLFADLRPDKFGKRGGNGTKMLGRWVRGLGLTDERLAPNHSWRHRVKTLGRRYGLAPDIVNAIMGHGSRMVADQYGAFEMAALHRELMKIPVLVLSSLE
ncbi:DUF6538 domain-containing protein [Methylobacterium oxalidis]|nr:DUF6538 domain-containing protein [Methylobacterium oxalidis]GJE34660.1 Tyrosine recombinase XerC [Methylobacterium oxalidis]